MNLFRFLCIIVAIKTNLNHCSQLMDTSVNAAGFNVTSFNKVANYCYINIIVIILNRIICSKL